MLRLLACLVLAGCVSPAAACINDLELPNHEREFRSQYRRQAAPPASPSTEAVPPGYRVMLGGGSVLLLGAFGLVVVGRRVRE